MHVDLLGLVHEMHEHLAEHGLQRFQDYSTVECELFEGTLIVWLTSPLTPSLNKSLRDWGRQHGFVKVGWVSERGRYSLHRPEPAHAEEQSDTP